MNNLLKMEKYYSKCMVALLISSLGLIFQKNA